MEDDNTKPLSKVIRIDECVIRLIVNTHSG